jgi:hypothetical protein
MPISFVFCSRLLLTKNIDVLCRSTLAVVFLPKKKKYMLLFKNLTRVCILTLFAKFILIIFKKNHLKDAWGDALAYCTMRRGQRHLLAAQEARASCCRNVAPTVIQLLAIHAALQTVPVLYESAP